MFIVFFISVGKKETFNFYFKLKGRVSILFNAYSGTDSKYIEFDSEHNGYVMWDINLYKLLEVEQDYNELPDNISLSPDGYILLKGETSFKNATNVKIYKEVNMYDMNTYKLISREYKKIS